MSEQIGLIIRLLRQILDGLGEVWIWGILPAYFLVYLLIGVITIRRAGSAVAAREIRNFRRRSAGEFLRQCLQRFCRTAVIVTVLAIILPTFLYLNLKHDGILTAILDNVSLLCSIAIGLATMVLTVSVVIILFHKNYYLVFSISDVLRSYHFTECLGLLLANCLGVCICTMIQLYLDAGNFWCKLVLLLLEWCILVALVSSGACFWIIYRVMFSNEKVELRLLDRLYQIFRGGEGPDEAQSGRAQNWEFGAVRTNIEYLCAEYVAAARTIPIHKIKRFEYLSGVERKESWNRLYHRVLNMIIFGALGIWFVSMLVVSIGLGTEGTGLMLLNTIMLAVVTVPAMMGFHSHTQRMELLFDDALGYEMDLEGRKIRIPRMTMRPANRYDRFVQKMNSLTAFFRIAVECGMGEKMTQRAIEVVIDWFSDVKEKHSCLYLPVFAAGYFAFAAGQEIPAVRECYERLILQPPEKADEKLYGTDQAEFDRMLCGHLSDLTRASVPAGNADAGAGAAAYLAWLHAETEQEKRTV